MSAIGPDEILAVKLRLIDGRKFQAEMAAAAGSVRAVGTAAETTGRSMQEAGRRGFLMNQALFTVRRLAYASTLAFGALATAGVAWGLDFNSTMETNMVAFEFFLGSASAAEKQLDHLYQMAALTPFEFPQLVDASRKFLAFGFTVEATNAIMASLGDTVAGLGIGAEGIDRAVLAIGQMHAAGRVLGGEIRQLTELGIPALKILQEELGLSGDQLARIGDLRIPAEVAIAALVRGMNKRFEGMAALQAKTFRGQITTLRDYTKEALGAITEPLFMKLRDDLLPTAVKVAEAITAGFEAGGWDEAVRRADAAAGANGLLIDIWTRGKIVAEDFVKVMEEGVLPVLESFARNLGALGLGTVIGLLAFLADHTSLASAAIAAYLYWIILSTAAHKIYAFWLGAVALKKKLVTVWTWASSAALVVYTFWTNLSVRAQMMNTFWALRLQAAFFLVAMRMAFTNLMIRAFVIAQGLMTIALGFMTGSLWAATAAVWAFTVALLANPITWVILAIVALGAALVFLYLKFEWFRNFVHEWGIFILGVFLGPIGLVIAAIIKWGDKLEWLFGKLRKIKEFFGGIWSGIADFGGSLGIPGLQHGGTILSPGLALVGEAGPEIVSLPRGASVIPISSQERGVGARVAAGATEAGVIVVHSYINLEGQQIAEVVERVRADRRARR